MNNEMFLIIAYGLIWAGLFAYHFFSNRQVHFLAARVAILEDFVSGKENKDE